MAEHRGAAGTLKGRLADVFVPALVDGALQALSRRLGNRATIDDPTYGHASTLASIEPLLEQISSHFRERGASYRHVASATGVDRDVSEGVLATEAGAVPIAVVAERRRLREIELRVYYASSGPQRRARPPLVEVSSDLAVPQIVAHVLDAFRKGAVERVLAAFEESSRFVDSRGRAHAKRDGSMAAFLAAAGDRIELDVAGAADDGRNCCIEATLTRSGSLHEPEPAALSFERGDSGLLRELRLYYEP